MTHSPRHVPQWSCDYNAGLLLAECVRSLSDEGVVELVVVENGDGNAARAILADNGLGDAPLLVTGRTLAMGAGPTGAWPLIEPRRVRARLQPRPGRARRAPPAPRGRARRPSGLGDRRTPGGDPRGRPVSRRPGCSRSCGSPPAMPCSARCSRRTPSPGATGPPTCRIAPPRSTGCRAPASWPAAAPSRTFGGFDEAYFMFAEDMDLCWRLGRAGWKVGFEPSAVVTHHEGVSRRSHPYRMAMAHHRSALRFASRSTSGPGRLLLPVAALGLGARLVASWSFIFLRRSGLIGAR